MLPKKPNNDRDEGTQHLRKWKWKKKYKVEGESFEYEKLTLVKFCTFWTENPYNVFLFDSLTSNRRILRFQFISGLAKFNSYPPDQEIYLRTGNIFYLILHKLLSLAKNKTRTKPCIQDFFPPDLACPIQCRQIATL